MDTVTEEKGAFDMGAYRREALVSPSWARSEQVIIAMRKPNAAAEPACKCGLR